MGRVTVFCVETFWRNKGRLEKGQLRQFGSEPDAIAAGRVLANRALGVAVYSVSGSPVMDLWDEPRMLEAFGEVPAIDPDPPPDEIQYFKIDCTDQGDTWTQVDTLAGEGRDEEAA